MQLNTLQLKNKSINLEPGLPLLIGTAAGGRSRQPERDSSLVCHSDRGSQYVSIRYTERLAEAGIEPSVDSKGDNYDNALAENINGLYKAELIHRRAPWKTKAAVESGTLEWVSWFNHDRLLEPIGYIPPAEAEANYYRQLASQNTEVVA
jgi:transposase InsO family protein